MDKNNNVGYVEPHAECLCEYLTSSQNAEDGHSGFGVVLKLVHQLGSL